MFTLNKTLAKKIKDSSYDISSYIKEQKLSLATNGVLLNNSCGSCGVGCYSSCRGSCKNRKG